MNRFSTNTRSSARPVQRLGVRRLDAALCGAARRADSAKGLETRKRRVLPAGAQNHGADAPAYEIPDGESGVKPPHSKAPAASNPP
jgi:hypothetical protein